MSDEFAIWLRQALAERDMSVRRLARLVYPENPETGRRRIYYYLGSSSDRPPISPRHENRQKIADALGMDIDRMPK